MNAILAMSTQSKVVGVGLFFLLVFLTGAWAGFSGSPYSVAIITIHKFVSVGAIVLLGAAVYQTNQAARLTAVEVTAVAATGLLFVGTIATGGMLSTNNPMPAIVSTMHRIAPFVTVLSSGAMLFLLTSRQ